MAVIYYYSRVILLVKFIKQKKNTIRWRCSVRIYTTKVYTAIRNIMMAVNENINEHSGHKQPNVERKLYSKEHKKKKIKRKYLYETN